MLTSTVPPNPQVRMLAHGLLWSAVLVFALFQIKQVGGFHPPMTTYAGCGGGYHPLPLRGYQVWTEGTSNLKHAPRDIAPKSCLLSSLATSSLLVLCSPFLLGVFSRSKPAWIVAVVASGMALAGTSLLLVWKSGAAIPWYEPENLLPLYVFPALNFAGLLIARVR